MPRVLGQIFLFVIPVLAGNLGAAYGQEEATRELPEQGRSLSEPLSDEELSLIHI